MLAVFGIARVTCAVESATAGADKIPGADSIEREINRHLEAIARYENEASSSDAQSRVFAQRILPQLQRHLELLRSLKPGN